jgi:endo-1,4-beta-xylanase
MVVMTAACATLASCAGVVTSPKTANEPPRQVCRNQTGHHNGYFFTFWKDGGEACIGLGPQGQYSTQYDLAGRKNLVAGKGWRTGSPTRKIGYHAKQFDAGSNSYLTLYGWSVETLWIAGAPRSSRPVIRRSLAPL